MKSNLCPFRMTLGCALVIATLAPPAHLHAQTTAPSNDKALRNAAQPPAAPSAPASAPAPGARTDAAPSLKFKLNDVQFMATHAITTAELQEVVKPFLHKEIDTPDLSIIAASIRRLYEQRGYGLVTIGFPTQDLSGGVLKIAIIEPTIGKISVDSLTGAPISEKRATGVLSRMGVQPGKPLDMQGLDRAMFALNDWPGVSAKATLMPTGDEGLYNVNVNTERRRAWDASVDMDNHGTDASGRVRVGTLLRWNNPGGIGDNLDLRAMVSNGNATMVGRLGYEMPVGTTPWRLGLGYSHVSYELGGVFEGAGFLGSADVLDASLSYPIVRSQDRNVIGRIGLENKRLSDENGDVTEKHIRDAQFGLSFEARDAWYGGGFNGGSVGLLLGRLQIDTPAALAADAAAGQTNGNFAKLSLQVNRLQAVNRTMSLFVGLAGQWANRNLDNAEKFTLGGDKGVRAYPGAEGSSDEGVLLNTEWRVWLNPRWTTFAFYDAAWGRLQKNPSPGADNHRTLHGAGLGVQFSDPELFTLKASVAVRGDEAVQSEPNQRRARLLVQLQHSF